VGLPSRAAPGGAGVLASRRLKIRRPASCLPCAARWCGRLARDWDGWPSRGLPSGYLEPRAGARAGGMPAPCCLARRCAVAGRRRETGSAQRVRVGADARSCRLGSSSRAHGCTLLGRVALARTVISRPRVRAKRLKGVVDSYGGGAYNARAGGLLVCGNGERASLPTRRSGVLALITQLMGSSRKRASCTARRRLVLHAGEALAAGTASCESEHPSFMLRETAGW
jgi:hypothetical protein